MFTEQQERALAAPLNGDHVKQRQGANRQSLSYLKGWQLIADANLIFGFGNWSRETLLQNGGAARAEIAHRRRGARKGQVGGGLFRARQGDRLRQGRHALGCPGGLRGRPQLCKTVGEAMENAIKAAETDAMKRALVTFGDPFGLALYDREQRNVAPRGNGRRQPAEQAIDTGFGQQRQATSQRAITARISKLADDIPV